MYVSLDDWLHRMEAEYLATFIPAGGASVKFAIPSAPITSDMVQRAFAELATRHDLVVLCADAATTRLHFIDQLFHHVAAQVDWDGAVAAFMRRLLAADGFVLPAEKGLAHYAAIAASSGTNESEVRYRVRALLTEQVLRDYAMIPEFRLAMVRLCQASLEPVKEELTEVAAIHQWLRGELRLISALKPAGIFQKVGRHLARDMFLSLAHWLRLTGRHGMLLTLDISRYTLDRRHIAPDGGPFYSSSAVLDVYEVLRQFIDATDDLEGCFIAVIAPPAFLTDSQRGLARYAALKMRIWDEVRDRHRANPLSSLVRLTDEAA